LDIDHKYPVQEVSTGLPFIIVPLKTLEALKKCRIDREKYFGLIKDSHAKAILVFCPETIKVENDLNVRVFAEYYGVTEDLQREVQTAALPNILLITIILKKVKSIFELSKDMK